MRLFVDVDCNKQTGWEGYDYVVNRLSPAAKATLERASSGWSWERAGEVAYYVEGRKMEIAIPIEALKLSRKGGFEIEFKWVDNSQTDGDIFDFYLSGDAAPLGRFNYLYRAK